MPTPARRRTASPDADDLAGLDAATPPGGRLRKAPAADPVLGVAGKPTDQGSGIVAPPRPGGRRPAPVTPPSKVKVGFYQDPADTARARAAFSWTRPQERHRSFSDFVAAALMREVERLEAEYHHGEPWPAMEPGELPTGKPLGS